MIDLTRFTLPLFSLQRPWVVLGTELYSQIADQHTTPNNSSPEHVYGGGTEALLVLGGRDISFAAAQLQTTGTKFTSSLFLLLFLLCRVCPFVVCLLNLNMSVEVKCNETFSYFPATLLDFKETEELLLVRYDGQGWCGPDWLSCVDDDGRWGSMVFQNSHSRNSVCTVR